jgi:hypothetical protein
MITNFIASILFLFHFVNGADPKKEKGKPEPA